MQAKTNQFIGCECTFDEAEIVLFGAPYDSTASFRPGTRFGPNAMRMESVGIETYSMAIGRDLACDAKVFDSGDIELPFGDQACALALIESRAAEIAAAGKIPFLLGGEHLVTLGAVRALAAVFPQLHIIHFDAHADLREDYLGNPLSHATVMRRCYDLLGDGRIFQFGIRSGTGEEREFMLQGRITSELFGDDTLAKVIDTIPSGAPVYLTIDMDVVDPAEFPGTGTPEAGGWSYLRLVRNMRLIAQRLAVVGIDNVELNPQLDPSGRSTALACKFLREELLSLRPPSSLRSTDDWPTMV